MKLTITLAVIITATLANVTFAGFTDSPTVKGAAAGFVAGSFIPVVGNIGGAVIGGFVGDKVGSENKQNERIADLEATQGRQVEQIVELRNGLNETREVVNSHSDRLARLEDFTPQTSPMVFGIKEGN